MEILNEPQGSEEWFEARLGLPTASRFGKIATPTTGKLSAQHTDVIAELIAESVERDRSIINSYWMERGRLLEGEARDWLAFALDAEIEEVGLIINDGLGYSPDGLIGDDTTVEIKCPAPKTHVKYLLAGELPREYAAQVYGGLIVSERKRCVFLSYCPNFNPLLLFVERPEPGEDVYFDNLTNTMREFKDAYEEAKGRFLGDRD